MKKIKLIPSLILLALCIAILGIGIYAAAPAGNTITGTVTITAASAEVEVSVYQDDYNPLIPATNRQSTATTRTGSNSLSMGDISLDASSAESIYDVPLKEVIIVVKNHSFSSDGQGMFFWKSTTEGAADNTLDVDGNGSVLVGDILYGHHKYDENDDGNVLTTEETDVIDVEYEFYKHLPAATDVNSNGVWDEGTDTAGVETIRFYIRLDKLVEDDVDIDLNVKLYIEKYIPNYSSSQTGFVKIGVGDLTAGDIPNSYDNGLTHVTMPYGLTTFTGTNNKGCTSYFASTSIETIGIPSSVTNMVLAALYNCTQLESVIIPDSVTTLEAVFGNCSALKTLVIPKSVSNFQAYYNRGGGTERCWNGLTALESISVDPNNATFTSASGANAMITKTACTIDSDGNQSLPANVLLLGCKNTIIPNTITRIYGVVGAYSDPSAGFAGCSGLTSITIPSSVTSIDDGAFKWCTSLTTILFNGTLSSAYYLPINDGYHWEFNESTVTTIATGAAAQGTYTRVANS